MTVAISFVERLIEGFTTGFAIATGVSLFIFPVSSRKVVFKELSGYLNLLGGMLKTQAAYLQSLEHFDLQAAMQNRHEQASKHGKKDSSVDYSEHPLMATPESLKLRGLMEKMYGLHTKIPSDINFAKREVAIGKMESKDMNQVWKRMRSIMVPIASLNTVVDILQRRAEESGWQNEHPNSEEAKTRGLQVERLHDIMQVLHEPMQSMSDKINGAMKHALILLELEKPPKKQQDLESHAEMPTPGTPDFTAAFKKQLDDFFDSKKRSLSEWCQHHDIRLPENFFDPNYRPDKIDVESEHNREKNQRQLFFALYVEYLLWRAGHATLELVLFVEQRKAEGALTKTRLIVPGVKTLKKWLRATFAREDFTDEDQLTADLDQGANSALNLGESFSKRKDPEHLPPRNIWEKIGEYIRLIPRALRSDASAFGLRVSVATMTVAIICFLHDSQQWFIRNRLLWAMIMVPISMTRTAGQSTLNFALRILGTAIAMVASYVIWYIVDGHTAGVIVFLWLWIFLAYYVVLKMPKLVIAGIISIVTAILIIGYELQVKQIGKAASSASGQPTYPTYVLAPYRLAAVSGGLFVAYFWTIFPYPVSETTELRKGKFVLSCKTSGLHRGVSDHGDMPRYFFVPKCLRYSLTLWPSTDLGAALYLLANLYSVTHETVRSRCLQIDGDEDVKGTRAYHLEKARIQVFSKLVTLLTTLKQNSNFSKFQLRVGGRFPQEEYESLIECLRRILSYTTLIAYASKTFSSSASDSKWSRDFRKLLASTNSTSHKVTSLLSLLSSSILNTQPLPPYLEIPQHSRYVKMLESIDGDILSIRHIAEPEYSAFACINICAMSINDDMVKITK